MNVTVLVKTWDTAAIESLQAFFEGSEWEVLMQVKRTLWWKCAIRLEGFF